MLSTFWQRNQTADGAAAEHSTASSSSANGGSSNMNTGTRQLMSQQQQLPFFKDRILVFHRGVGVSTAEGLYLDKKIDLLLGYLITDPLTRLLGNTVTWVNSLAASNNNSTPSSSEEAEERVVIQSTGHSSSSSSSKSWRQYHQPFSSSDLSHRYVRYVVRRSLRSIMPGPREVLQKFGDVITLQVSCWGCRGLG